MLLQKKRILFVDDEPNLLDGLRRMLRAMRDQWDMVFVASGCEALQQLSQSHFDVIVSDMRMPEMDGAELLSRVLQQYPSTVRIALSGQSDQDMIMKAVRSTHQFLAKPCHPDVLKETIQRASNLREILMNDALQSIISKIDSLPSIPRLYNAIMNELTNPLSSGQSIGKIIAQDVSMTAQILKLVNSAFFGIYHKVKDPIHAVTLLGVDTIKTLALSIEIFANFNIDPKLNFSAQRLWSHSFNVGRFAKAIAIAQRSDSSVINDAFMAGFLHDIGKLIIVSKIPAVYLDALRLMDVMKISQAQAEIGLINTSHGEMGAYLLGLWGFSDVIVEAVAAHHDPALFGGNSFSAAIAVYAADIIDNQLNNRRPAFTSDTIDLSYLSHLGLKERLPDWVEMCKEIRENSHDA